MSSKWTENMPGNSFGVRAKYSDSACLCSAVGESMPNKVLKGPTHSGRVCLDVGFFLEMKGLLFSHSLM